MSNDILTTQETAKRLGVSKISVRTYIRKGFLKAYKYPKRYKQGHWHIFEKDLENFMKGY